MDLMLVNILYKNLEQLKLLEQELLLGEKDPIFLMYQMLQVSLEKINKLLD